MAPASLDSFRERVDAALIDLDGTLLDERSQVSPRTRDALRRLNRSGTRIMLCTGRSAIGTIEAYDALGLSGEVVSLNGSWIGEPRSLPAQQINLSTSCLDDVFRYESSSQFSFRYHQSGKFTVRTDHPVHGQIMAWYRDPRVVAHAREMPSSDLPRVTLFFDGHDAQRKEGWSSLSPSARAAMRREVFPLDIFPEHRDSSMWLVELQAACRGKAEGVDWLEQRYGIASERVVAIGDHRNDLPMLHAAGFALAMENGVDEVRNAADLVIGHHARDGLADWVDAGAPLAANELAL